MKIYIAGKISGLSESDVRRKFAEAEAELRAQGHEPVSPLDNGCDAQCWCAQMMACLPLLINCQAIYLLSDWQQSEGATIERTFAVKKGMRILNQTV